MAAVLVPAGTAAQTPGEIRDRCVGEFGGGIDRCTDVAVGARALTGSTTLLAGWGSEVPGSASTLGTKIRSRPRWSSAVRAGAMSVGLPDIFDQGTGSASDVSFMVPSVQVALAAGVLDGFSPMPTVGGVFALDLFGSFSVTMPPSAQGFRGSGTSASLGARVGLLRESFTLPGVSVAVSHRFVGTTAMGDVALGDPASIELDPSVTSVRATLGKDLFGVGVLAGVGWDHASSDAILQLQGVDPDPIRIATPLDARRRLYFGAASLNFLLLQLSLEGGWAEGYPAVPGGAGSTFDAAAGSPFGGLSLRFTP
jgi:hypothetical protein